MIDRLLIDTIYRVDILIFRISVAHMLCKKYQKNPCAGCALAEIGKDCLAEQAGDFVSQVAGFMWFIRY